MRKSTSYLTILFTIVIALSSLSYAQSWQEKIRNSGKSSGIDWRKELRSHYFYIKAATSDKFWDLPGHHPNTAKNGSKFQLWDFDDDPYERTFTFVSINGTDNFAIKNLAGYYVDVEGKTKLSLKETLQKKAGKHFQMKKDKGTKLQTWTMDNNGCPEWKQWRIVVVNSNTVEFINIYSGKAIDMAGGGYNINQNGTALQQWDQNNSAAQQFQLVYADGPRKGQILKFN